MAERIPQSATIRVPIQAFLSSDHVSPATGKTIAITISKNGAAYGNPSGGATNAVEIASGSYYVDLSTTDTGTLGPLFILGSVATVDPVNIIYNVVKATNGGLTALPDTAATTNASLLTSGTGTDQLSVTSGRIDIGKALGTAITLDSNNVINVSTKYVGGTLLTARDIGLSVLLSSGTGTGQLSITSGVVQADVAKINGVATTSVTTINANVGTTQPQNFTGTGASALVKSDMVDIAGSAVSTSSAQIGVNAVNIGGTAQTGRDIGASVLLSAGTGTGQLDFTSGVVKANATQWLGGTIPAVNVTGVPLVDVKYILGTISPATAGYAALDWGQVTGKTTANALTGTTISTSQVVASVSGAVGSVTGAVGSVTGAVGSVTGAVGSVTGSVGSVVGAVGSVTGNVGGSVGSVVGAVGSVTGNVGGNLTGTIGGYAAGQDPATLVLYTTLTEGYAALHAVPTLAQMTFEIRAQLAEKSVTSTTLTIKKIDGSTTAETFTLSDATNPTSITRAS